MYYYVIIGDGYIILNVESKCCVKYMEKFKWKPLDTNVTYNTKDFLEQQNSVQETLKIKQTLGKMEYKHQEPATSKVQMQRL